MIYKVGVNIDYIRVRRLGMLRLLISFGILWLVTKAPLRHDYDGLRSEQKLRKLEWTDSIKARV